MQVYAQLASAGNGFSFSMGADDNENISDETGRFTVKRVPRGQIAIQGMAKEWKESDYTFFRVLRTVTGETSTIDVGDIGVIKKRIKEGQPSGELGINFVDLPEDTPPDKITLEVSYIDPKGPAATSGIKVGDVVTSIDGVDVTGGNYAHAWTLMNASPGTKLALGLKRGVTVNIVLAAP
jgi:C-terminal processing protease CtpA/Prc